jgi:hypothetical protein
MRPLHQPSIRHRARQPPRERQPRGTAEHSHHYAAFAQGALGKLKWVVKTAAMAVSPLIKIPRIATTDRLTGPRARVNAFLGLAVVRLYRARKMVAVMLDPATKAGNMTWNRQ